MSYQVLARKWRPRNFHEMVGQDHVLRALVNALDNDRLHHAYLFTGTRGVGKTTIARILSKSLNCEKGVTSEPCGQCSSCTEIDEGRFVDLIEVDAASRTKVDETRELLENVQYAPTRGRYKVYLIDEVHMFSNHSFNALLKTLEEPPPHVKFLLATTDPQKLPVTILSRCLQFNLKRLPLDRIHNHLQDVLGKESIVAEEGGIRLLTRAADGSMRDALSLLDQAIAFGGGTVSEADVRTMLGTIEHDHVLKVLKGLATADGAAVLAAVEQAAQQAPDFAGLLAEMLALLQHVALAQAVPDALDENLDNREAVVALAKEMTPEDVQLFYQIGLIGRRDLPLAPDARGGLEMVLLRMLAFRPAAQAAAAPPAASNTPAATAAAPRGSAAARAALGQSSAAPEKTTATPSPSSAASGAAAARAALSQPAAEKKAAPPPPAPVVKTAVNAGAETVRETPVGAAPMPPPVMSDEMSAPYHSMADGLVAGQWNDVVSALKLKGVLNELAQNCVLVSHGDGQVQLVLDPDRKQLHSKEREQRLSQALAVHLGESVAVHIEISHPAQETPARQQARMQNERQQAAVTAIVEDPNVKALQDAFGAQVSIESVRPLDS